VVLPKAIFGLPFQGFQDEPTHVGGYNYVMRGHS
jgi:hypothetical protein